MKYLVLTIITFFLISCTAKKATTSDDNNHLTTNEVIKNIILDMDFQAPKDNAIFEIKKASIEGDILTLEVSYSGGCQEHEFNAYFNGVYMKSMPPKAGIFIHHINNDDNCRELKTEVLQFSLENLRAPEKESDYTIMIGVNNYEGYLEYKY